MSQFHLFPKLPKELRTLIWSFALYPMGQPGAHYMTLVQGPWSNGDLATDVRYLDLFERSLPDRRHSEQTLPARPQAARHQHGSDQPPSSWPSHSSSSCLLDYGLLTACRESRDIVYGYLRNSSRRPGNDSLTRSARIGSSSTPLLLFNFTEDLFIFRFADRCTVPGQSWYMYFKQQMGLSQRENVLNIGLEYDSARQLDVLDMLQEPFKTLTSAVVGRGRAVDACRIWIVDYNIPEDEECEVNGCDQEASHPVPSRFHSRDCVFVETFLGQKPSDGLTRYPTVFATARLFQSWLQGITKHSSYSTLGDIRVGVLRCLPSGSTGDQRSWQMMSN